MFIYLKKIKPQIIYILIFLIFFSCSKENKSSNEQMLNDNISITNLSELNEYLALDDDLNYINGSLLIKTGSFTNINSNDVNEFTRRLDSVSGDILVYSNDNQGIDFSNLKVVRGTYAIFGSEPNDDGLLIARNVILDYFGNYTLPNLTSVQKVVLADRVSPSSKKTHFEIEIIEGDMFLAVWDGAIDLTVDIAGFDNTISFGEGEDFSFDIVSEDGEITQLLEAPENFDEGHIEDDENAPNCSGYGGITFNNMTNIDIDHPAKVECLESPIAEEIILGYEDELDELRIIAENAQEIAIYSSEISNRVDIYASYSELIMPNVEIIDGNVTIDAENVSFANIETITGNLNIISSGPVSFPNLRTVAGNITITSSSSVDLVSLTNVSGDLNIEAEEVIQNTGQPHNSGGN